MPHDRYGRLIEVGDHLQFPIYVEGASRLTIGRVAGVYPGSVTCNVIAAHLVPGYFPVQSATVTAAETTLVLKADGSIPEPGVGHVASAAPMESAPPVPPGGPDMSGFGRLAAVIATGILAALALCGSALAQEPTPSPGVPVAWSASAIGGTIRTAAGDFKPIVGARFVVKLDLPAGFVAGARVDASRQQDGGAGVDLTDPSTFQTAEGYGVLYRDVWRGVGLAGVYGAAVPFEGGQIAALERYPQTILAALRYGSPGVTVYAGLGRHDAAGPGLKTFVSVEVATGGKTATQVEVVQPNGYVRVLALLRLR
jgi:hypothetical protein